MVKRRAIPHVVLTGIVLIICGVVGFAVAKETFKLGFLPVDHDMDMVTNKTLITLNQLAPESCPIKPDLIKKYLSCKKCRLLEVDGKCPNCCLYEDASGGLTKVHCAADGSDPVCKNPGVPPFSSSCASCDNFPKDCACASNPAACTSNPDTYSVFKCLTGVTKCYNKGCPGSMEPNDSAADTTCEETSSGSGKWICNKGNLKSPKACKSLNTDVPGCEDFSEKTDAYDVSGDKTCPGTMTSATGKCWEYTPTHEYKTCVTNCKSDADKWEIAFNKYHCGLTSNAVCAKSAACKGGFSRNCDKTDCKDLVDHSCTTDYTVAKCKPIEKQYRETFITGEVADCFREINPSFVYKFVARSSERYVVMWQVLCDVVNANDEYNFYTMVKILDEDTKAVKFKSVIHEKALLSTFFINAQTGFDKSVLTPGHAYQVRLYYFLPKPEETGVTLKVNIPLTQMIIYRTKD